MKLCTGLVEPKVKIYECDVCDCSTGRKDTLVRHKSSQHTKFICEVCCFQFDSKAKLRRHEELVHNGSKPSRKKIKCQSCEFKSPYASNVKKHEGKCNANVF